MQPLLLVPEPVPPERSADLARFARTVFTESYVHDDDPEGFASYVASAFADQAVANQLSTPGVRFAWTLDDGEPIAFLKADDLQPPEHDERLPALSSAGGLHVQRLYVRKSHQRRGVGRHLLEHAVALARTDGRTHVWLCVWDQNVEAIDFYQRLGFRGLGAHPFEIGNQVHRDLAFSHELTEGNLHRT